MTARLAYFAYPIDQAPMASQAWLYEFINDTMRDWRNQGLISITFDPGDAFKIASHVNAGPEVETINRFAQSVADLTVACLPKGVPTVGVPVEIDRAVAGGRNVVIFTDADSWSLAGMVNGRSNVKVVDFTIAGRDQAADWLRSRPSGDAGNGSGVLDPLPTLLLSEEGSRLPTRGYHDDAGLDLYVDRYTLVQPNSFVDVPCGVAVQLPEWSWGLITGRSSTLRKKGLLVHQGIIDAGWRGPLFAGVWNLTSHPVEIDAGERIAQLIVMPNTTKDLDPVKVGALDEHPRGQNGFGSTGA